MATGEKPYRVYRGGRAKGRVPLERPQTRPDRNGRTPREPRVRRPRRRWSWRRRIGLAVLALVVLLFVWAIAGYLSFRGGVAKANERLQKTSPGVNGVLAPQNGAMISNPTTILMLGRDFANTDARVADNHSDSIMILRTDPDHHRLAYLSIPRDLRVPIPGYGDSKVNAAMQIGGPALAIKTIEAYTGLPINHVIVADFTQFKDVIDAIGGVTVDVPERIISNFDCPYTVARCARWRGWRFAKGEQHMDGRRALVYSRVRKNALNPADTDITRIERQQQVLQAMLKKMTSLGTLVKLPFIGKKLVRPLATDVSAAQLMQIGWVYKRAHALHCRLGGTPATLPDGESVIVAEGDDKSRVILTMLGKTAPLPPRPGEGPYGAGCVSGSFSR